MASKTVNRKLLITINGKEIENSITNINKQIRQLKKNIAGATDPAERKKYNDELKKAYGLRKDINDELGNTKSNLDKIKAQLGPVGAAFLAAFSVQALLSLGNALVDNIKLFTELKQQTKLLTGLQGEMLDSAVSKTKALADTFDTDYKENLIVANALSKQFGVNYEEALTAIEKGYLAGANVSGDMLNQLEEYAPLMKEANIELDEMVALIAQTEKEGIFNDKGIDAIKEGMLAIREGTDATRDALSGLGLDTNKIYADLKAGNTDYFTVLQTVSGKLGELEDQSPEVGTAIADIFKGAGEDAGLDFLKGIKDVDLELNNLIDTSDEYTRLKQEELEINEKLNDAWVTLSSTGGVLNKAMLSIKGTFADLIQSINDTYTATTKLYDITGRENKTPWYSWIVPGTSVFSSFNKANENLKGLINSLEETKKSAVTAPDALQKVSEAIKTLQAERSTIQDNYANADDQRKIYDKYIEDLTAQLVRIEKTEVAAAIKKENALGKVTGGNSGSNKGESRSVFAAKAAAKKEEAERVKLLNKIQDLEEKALLAKLDLDQREIQQIVNKYAKLLAVAEDGSKEQMDLEILQQDEIDAKKLEQETKFQEEKEKVRQQYNLLSNTEKQQQEIDALTALYERKLVSEEDFQKAKKGIIDAYDLLKKEEEEAKEEEKRAKFEEDLELILEDEALTDEMRYEAQLERLDEALANQELSQKEYEERVSALKFEQNQKRLQSALQTFQALDNLVSKAKQFELDSIKEVTQRKGESEESFIKRKEEAEKKKAEINKKYALVELLITVGKTIASTALGIMQAYAQLGPIGGSIFAAIVGTVGAIEIGMAKKQYNDVKSFNRGGFTGFGDLGLGSNAGGNIRGVVEEGEYVVPKFVTMDTTDPMTSVALQYLEGKRQKRSFANGGSADDAGTFDISDNENFPLIPPNGSMELVLNQLLFRLENPLPSPAYLNNEEAEAIKKRNDEVKQARDGAIVQ